LEKRTIVAFLLIFVIWIVFTQFIWRPGDTSAQQQPQATGQSQQRQPVATAPRTPVSYHYEEGIAPRQVELANDVLALTFSNRGGVITQAVLKDYQGNDRETPVRLLPEESHIADLNLYTADGLLPVSNKLWRDTVFTDTENRQVIEFTLRFDDQHVLCKRYTLGSGYDISLDITGDPFPGITGYSLALRGGIEQTEGMSKYRDRDWKAIAQVDHKTRSYTLAQLKKLDPGNAIPVRGDIDWAGIRSKYFGMIVLPDVSAEVSSLQFDARHDAPALYLRADNNRATLANNYHLYIGPVQYSQLKKLYPTTGVESMAEMGGKLLRPISSFFLIVLKGINGVVHNFGVSIILFSIIFKLALTPLTHKSFESAQRMQKIQPQVQELQRKHRKDPQQLNVELNKLYKESGVNPMGGCLPLLLQMPLLFALYPILRYSIALRQAPFAFWLTDLSEADPYYILPIIMGLAMFLQQRFMTPKTDTSNMDERQRAQMQSTKMMGYFMPVFMVVLFLNYPSGLVLYWLIYNLLSIGEQLLIKRKFA